MNWADLTEDERRFLAAWYAAPAEARQDALAVLLNGRRHEDTQEAEGVIIPFDAARDGQ